MAFTHGSNATLSVNAIALTAFVTDVTFPRTTDTAETTVFGNTAKTYIPGLVDGTLSISGLYDKTASTGPIYALEAVMTGAAAVTCIWRPAGASTGNYSYTFSAIMTSFEIDSSVGDSVKFSADFQKTGVTTVAVL